MVCIDNYGNLVTYEDGYSTNELYHHGILGQRWGRKNGPPYPLGAGDHSASEKKAGWRKSLGNIAKATGSGVARGVRATARGVGKGVVGTAKGVAAVAKGTKKALIRVNLYPKQLMSDQDIVEKLNRMDMEAAIKRAKGKMTAEDKLNLKLKKKDTRRELVKNVLSQLIPAIGKDLLIGAIKDRREVKMELKKKQGIADIEADSKVREDIYEDARAAGKSAYDANKLSNSSWWKNKDEVASLQPRKNNKIDPMFEKQIKQELFKKGKEAGLSSEDAAKVASSADSRFYDRIKESASPKTDTSSTASASSAVSDGKAATVISNPRKEAAAKAQATKLRNQTIKEARAAQESFNQWENRRKDELLTLEKQRANKAVKEHGGSGISISNGKIEYIDSNGISRSRDFENVALDKFNLERRRKIERDVYDAFG